MRLGGRAQEQLHALDLVGVALAREIAAHQLESQEDQIGVEHVRFAVAADVDDLAGEKRVPHLVAGESELAGQAEQARHVASEARARAWKPDSTSMRSMCRQW